MAYTANNLSVSNGFRQVYLMQMPSHFTALEVRDFEQQFQEICQPSSAVQTIICDFAQTIFLDTSGLASLCQIFKLAQKQDINLAFSSFSPQIKIILSLSGLDRLFLIDIYTEKINVSNN